MSKQGSGEFPMHPIQEELELEREYLDFERLRVANQLRVCQFKNNIGELAHSKTDGSDWTIAEWTNAMAGETGEACNLSKKLRRGDFNNNLEHGIDRLCEELADAVIYADLCCARVGRSLGDEVRKKFNSKSKEIGVDIFI